MRQVAISAARSQLGDLVRRAAHGHETVALTDHGQVAALLVSPQVIEDLEDALALAEYELRKARGDRDPGVPHGRGRPDARAAVTRTTSPGTRGTEE